MSCVFHWVLCRPVLPWEAGEGVKLLDKVRGRPAGAYGYDFGCKGSELRQHLITGEDWVILKCLG